MLKPHQEKMMKLMVEHETCLFVFYSILAEKLPEEKEFFLELAEEEKEHAAMVESLYDLAKEEKIKFNEGSLRTFTLMAAIDYLKDVTEKAERGELSIRSALVHTQDMETALIEKIFFKSFITDNEEVITAFKMLKKQTSDHLERVRNKLSEYRGKK